MRPLTWAALSFGYTLALVVGVRLSLEGLWIMAAILLSALLLCPFIALRWVAAYLNEQLPEVHVTRPPSGGLAAPPRRALMVPKQGVRRGGWPHLERRRQQRRRRRQKHWLLIQNSVRRSHDRHLVDG